MKSVVSMQCTCSWDHTQSHIVSRDPNCSLHNKEGAVIPVKDLKKETLEEVFSSGAKRSKHPSRQKHHLVPSHAQRRLACRFGLGDENYPRYNWRKGIPFSNLLDHAEEHLQKLKDKLRDNPDYRPDLDDDEAAIAWAMFAIMQFQCEGRSKELNDIYWDKEAPINATS